MTDSLLSFSTLQDCALECLTTIYEKGPQNMKVGTENKEEANIMLKFQLCV